MRLILFLNFIFENWFRLKKFKKRFLERHDFFSFFFALNFSQFGTVNYHFKNVNFIHFKWVDVRVLKCHYCSEIVGFFSLICTILKFRMLRKTLVSAFCLLSNTINGTVICSRYISSVIVWYFVKHRQISQIPCDDFDFETLQNDIERFYLIGLEHDHFMWHTFIYQNHMIQENKIRHMQLVRSIWEKKLRTLRLYTITRKCLQCTKCPRESLISYVYIFRRVSRLLNQVYVK